MTPHTLHPHCAEMRQYFSSYLDGAISGREMQVVAGHLEGCTSCAADFAQWRTLQQVLAASGPVKAPSDLGLKLRVAISHEQARREGRWRNTFSVRWDNVFRPVLLQASAGLAGALLLVGGIAMLVGVVAVPQAVLANDEPLGALSTPHYLYSESERQAIVTSADTTIVVQAEINAQGKVYDWTILAGPNDEQTRAEVRDELMLEVYEPARMFGEPVRGRVLVTFSGVSVRG